MRPVKRTTNNNLTKLNTRPTMSHRPPNVSKPIGLLVSVRDFAEARVGLDSKVDILDLKEPNAGALGAVAVEVMAGVVQLTRSLPTQQQPRLSFAAGELMDWDFERFPRLLDRYPAELAESFQFVKVGLAGANQTGNWPKRLTQLFDGLQRSTQPVAVAYADYQDIDSPSIQNVIQWANQYSKTQTVLLDTYQKNADLFTWLSEQQLARTIHKCHDCDLSIVVAGSLSQQNIDRVKPLSPDYVGVRGAVCEGSRRSAIDESRVRDFQQTLGW